MNSIPTWTQATFVEEQLGVDYGRLITYIKQTEPLLMQGASSADIARADLGAMEHLLRSFHDTWQARHETCISRMPRPSPPQYIWIKI